MNLRVLHEEEKIALLAELITTPVTQARNTSLATTGERLFHLDAILICQKGPVTSWSVVQVRPLGDTQYLRLAISVIIIDASGKTLGWYHMVTPINPEGTPTERLAHQYVEKIRPVVEKAQQQEKEAPQASPQAIAEIKRAFAMLR